MKEKSITSNFIFNVIYTGMNFVFPLITAPYISRVLGSVNLGYVNFASSFINWFVILSIFGSTTLGVREVSRNKHDSKKLSNAFSEILSINIVAAIFSAILYFFIILTIPFFRSNIKLFVVMSFSILLNVLTIDWFYQGIEEYKYITLRNAIFKTISLFFIFLCIKQEQDYILYGLISISAIGLNGIFNIMYSRRFVTFSFKPLAIIENQKILSIYFITTLIVNVYTNIDQTLLGFLSSSSSVAFMNRGRLVTNAIASISNSLSNVIMPRAFKYYEEDKNKYHDLVNKVPVFFSLLIIPICIGVFLLSDEAMLLLGGEEFLPAGNLLKILSISVYFSILSGFIQNQVLLPAGKEKVGLIVASICSLGSVVLNVIFITKFDFIGAAFAVLFSEGLSFILRYWYVKSRLRKVKLVLLDRNYIKIFIAAISLIVFVITIKYNFKILSNVLILSILGGMFVYLSALILLRENTTSLLLKRLKDSKNLRRKK